MRKVRVLFPAVEAGLGHIMPMNAVSEIFEKKYGDKVEVIKLNFFDTAKDEKLHKFQDVLIDEVHKYNKNHFYGYFRTINMNFWNRFFVNWGTMQVKVPFSDIAGRNYMEELHPDVVFSTHWATNFYAEHVRKNKPITILYCPDTNMNKLFCYNADLYLISMKTGYEEGLKKYHAYLNTNNFKMVPFLIRNEAFSISMDKRINRKNLGLPIDKFTILIAEGGYGIGKLQPLCEKLTKEHLPISVIAVTGKNPELYNYLKTLKSTPEVTFIPLPFVPNMLEYQASADLFCGKSGNIIAEPTFFGVPSIITSFSNNIEQNIGSHYINNVGSAIKEFDVDKIIELIKKFVANPELLKPYQDAAIKYHNNYGAEKTADIIMEEILKKYPTLQVDDKGE